MGRKILHFVICQNIENAPLEVGCGDISNLTYFTLLRSLHLLLEVFEDTLDENPAHMKDDGGCKRQEDLPVVEAIAEQVGDEEEGEVDVGGGDADEIDNDPGEEEKSL